MATLEQRYTNTRYFNVFLCLFLFLIIFGQATLYPVVLNYNYSIFPTNWFIFILTFTIIILCICIYLSVRIIRDTYADFIF